MKLIVPKELQVLLHKFSGLYRYWYNKCVWIQKTTGMRRKLDFAAVIKADHNRVCSPWVLDLPTALREGAPFELAKNIKAAQANSNNGHAQWFKMKFKQKRDPNLSGFALT
ncbi:hypothetical protein BDK51DRAFT_49000 [Blyttiomyces helicus]|uniref:Transposase putative helix-turn-helix domain-containing protein n=1 Tax=Blyttiomyces helicus TaxID=388810 RepID=A0A4P9WPL4_9FUNG|nr:hypothetical protein BDK51DRAFT_49000 [Blyttiomyces helicus]|eukprot:RKO94462.1 hypothetical protein BDK51DRAFT_49000 [Blyttiomyces helicus]